MNTTSRTPSSPLAPGQKAAETLQTAFARYQDELLGMLYYLVGNADDAYDAFQETFSRCWRRRESMPGQELLRSWIFPIGLGVGRDKRSLAWRRRHRSLPGEDDLVDRSTPGAGQVSQRGERLARLRRALLALRCEEQEVFLLSQNGQMTYEAIAAATRVPLATVKLRMRLALGKLHEALHDGD